MCRYVHMRVYTYLETTLKTLCLHMCREYVLILLLTLTLFHYFTFSLCQMHTYTYSLPLCLFLSLFKQFCMVRLFFLFVLSNQSYTQTHTYIPYTVRNKCMMALYIHLRYVSIACPFLVRPFVGVR